MFFESNFYCFDLSLDGRNATAEFFADCRSGIGNIISADENEHLSVGERSDEITYAFGEFFDFYFCGHIAIICYEIFKLGKRNREFRCDTLLTFVCIEAVDCGSTHNGREE